MKNEIYEKAKEIVKDAKKQMEDFLDEKLSDPQISITCSIIIHSLPESEMPENSMEKFIEDGRYLVFSPDISSNVILLSKRKKGRFVYDENPATCNVKPETIKS